MPLSFENSGPNRNFKEALEAIASLTSQDLTGLFMSGQMAASNAHSEIELEPVSRKTGPFYRHFLPLREHLVTLLGNSYRLYFKLALAHPHQTGPDPDKWTRAQLQPDLGATLEWIRDWYILACDGENQWVQDLGSVEYALGQTVSLPIPSIPPNIPAPKSWRAPAWLIAISLAHVGIGRLKKEHFPLAEPEQRLGASHTRLILKGARRVFVWGFCAAIERVRDEETAAAGALPQISTESERTRRPINRKGRKERENLYKHIRRILREDPRPIGLAFCDELEKRHARPLFDWVKSGEWRDGLTWREAWGIPGLKKKIRRVRQEAMKHG